MPECWNYPTAQDGLRGSGRCNRLYEGRAAFGRRAGGAVALSRTRRLRVQNHAGSGHRIRTPHATGGCGRRDQVAATARPPAARRRGGRLKDPSHHHPGPPPPRRIPGGRMPAARRAAGAGAGRCCRSLAPRCRPRRGRCGGRHPRHARCAKACVGKKNRRGVSS